MPVKRMARGRPRPLGRGRGLLLELKQSASWALTKRIAEEKLKLA